MKNDEKAWLRAANIYDQMGLPSSRTNSGYVELSIQEYSARTRWVARNYPADRIPAVGDEIQLTVDGTIEIRFMVMEVKHLLVPRAKETVRAAFVVVEKTNRSFLPQDRSSQLG